MVGRRSYLLIINLESIAILCRSQQNTRIHSGLVEFSSFNVAPTVREIEHIDINTQPKWAYCEIPGHILVGIMTKGGGRGVSVINWGFQGSNNNI